MVTCHKKSAVTRLQLCQRCHVRGQCGYRAIHQIPRNSHHVSSQRVDLAHNTLQIGLLDSRAHMDVTYLCQRKTLQRTGQTLDRHIHMYHGRCAPRVEKTHDCHPKSQQRHRCRRQPRDLRQRDLPRQRLVCQRQHQQGHITQRRQYEQRRKQTHQQQPDPAHSVSPRLLEHPASQQTQRHQQR